MDRAILISIFSFVLGIFVSSFVFVLPILSLLLVLIGAAIAAGEKIYRTQISTPVLALSLAMVFFSFGSLRYSVKDFHELQIPTNEGVVVSEPESRDNATRFILRSDNGEKALVSTDLYSAVQYGDRVSLKGRLERPEAFDGFDYPKYLSKDDIFWIMNFAQVEILSSRHGHPLKSNLLKLKSSFLNKIRETFVEPYASLLSGLLLAGKDAMPKNILEEFRRAGIVHIVVLSGYNITIIADFLRRIFQNAFLWFRIGGPRIADVFSIAGIILFVFMTGAEATVVRASLMVLTVIAARMLGRRYSPSRALVLAGFAMLLHNPKILVFDPSFQLSFLATLGLMYFVPIVEQKFGFITRKLDLRGIVATTIGTQAAVLPLLIYSTGDFSLVSLPANVVALTVVPYAMLTGFLTTAIAYINVFLALPLAYVAQLLLWWIIKAGEFFANMKFASIAIPSIPFWLVASAYVAMLILVWRIRNSFRRSASLN